MLGPLPRLYKVAVGVGALLAFVGLGVWAAQVAAVPLVAGAGAWIGAVLGAVAAYLLVHDQHTRTPQAHRVRRPRY